MENSPTYRVIVLAGIAGTDGSNTNAPPFSWRRPLGGTSSRGQNGDPAAILRAFFSRLSPLWSSSVLPSSSGLADSMVMFQSFCKKALK